MLVSPALTRTLRSMLVRMHGDSVSSSPVGNWGVHRNTFGLLSDVKTNTSEDISQSHTEVTSVKYPSLFGRAVFHEAKLGSFDIVVICLSC